MVMMGEADGAGGSVETRKAGGLGVTESSLDSSGYDSCGWLISSASLLDVTVFDCVRRVASASASVTLADPAGSVELMRACW